MNIHVPQSYEARAEIENLLMVPYQVISPKNSGPVIGIIQDALLGSFKLTNKNVFITRSFLMQICMQIDEFDGILPTPAILKPEPLWTGKQVVSLIIPKTLYMKKKNNTYNNKKGENPWIQIEKDSLVVIERGMLLTGVLDKKTLGISGGSIIHIIYKDYGPEICKKFLNQIQYIANYWLLHFGFSVGISDCILEKHDQSIIQDIITKAIETVDTILTNEIYDRNVEEKVNKVLNAAGTDVGSYVKDNLPFTNCLGEMVNGGSKGNALNLVQMMGLVGQQNVMGKRIPLSYSGRSVPHVKMGDHGPQARGFVTNPYYDGLTPLELLFHTQGGREGLVDTAIKTADTGYTTRRLIKAMEDLIVRHDGTVRNSMEHIIQFQYGEDQFDACSLEEQGFDRLNSNSLFEWSEEELIEQYERTLRFMPSTLTPQRFATFMAIENKKLAADYEFLIQFFERSREKTILVPVNIDRLIERIKYENVDNADDAHNIFKFDNGFMLNPLYISGQIELMKLNIFTFTLQNGNREYRENKLFEMLLRDKLHPHRIMYQYELTLKQFHSLLQYICDIVTNSFVQAGEMIGTIAAQSIGEPAQQMTLNSVDWTECIIVKKGQQNVYIGEIGKFIDELIEKSENVQKLPDERDYLDIKDLGYSVVTVDEDGKMSWELLEAVTRHLPGGVLVKAKTRCGRVVKATQADSFLVRSNNKIVSKRGDQLVVGDYLPIVDKFPVVSEPLTHLDLTCYFPKNEYISDILTDKLELDELTGFLYGAYLVERNDAFQVNISNNDLKYRSRIKEFCQRYNIRYFTVIQKDKNIIDQHVASTTSEIHSILSIEIHSILLHKLMVTDCGGSSSDKHIPSWAVLANNNFVKGLLDGYFSGNGTLTNKNFTQFSFTASSASKQLIWGIGSLLTRLGISSTFSKQPKKIGIKKSYNLNIRNNDLKTFYNKIGFTIDEKQDALHKMQTTKFPHLNNLDNLDVLFSPVTEISSVESTKPKVYDLTVAKTRNFTLFNGLAVKDTFHSAGVSSRNVTLGVPRLTELINCSKNPKTPSISVYLKREYAGDKEMVKQVKAMLCHTTLEDLLDPNDCRSAVANYTTETIEPYMEDFYELQFTQDEIARFCPWMIRLKFVPELLEIKGLTIIAIANYIEQQFGGDLKCIYSDPNASQSIIHAHIVMVGASQMQEDEIVNFFKEIHNKLKELLICGTTGIEKAYIVQDQFADGEWLIETEGTNLLEILNHPMVDATKTISNHPMEVQDILGIEAAHQSIIDQIRNVMEQYGINVQYRHLSVLANVMTKDGDMMSITRHGINRREDSSPLTKATFEETGDMIFEAAIGALKDDLNSVSSRLILGLPARLGTGFCEIAVDTNANNWNDTLGNVKQSYGNNSGGCGDDDNDDGEIYENNCEYDGHDGHAENSENSDEEVGNDDDDGFVDEYDMDSDSDNESEDDHCSNAITNTTIEGPPIIGLPIDTKRKRAKGAKGAKEMNTTKPNSDPFAFL
jgi:DNA-directed RNA polymerase beta' subunit